MPAVTVIDSIMGSGKTSVMVTTMNHQHHEAASRGATPPKFIYVTPILSEVDRITSACPALSFKNPQPINGRKYWGLQELIKSGENIATTHSLFSRLTRDIYEDLQKQGYTLVIDEALDCVSLFEGLTKADFELMMEQGMLSVDPDTHRLVWNEQDHGKYRGKFDHIMGLARNGNLIYYRNSLILWEFPIEFIDCFQQVFILTYLFHGSAMANYLKAGGVEMDMWAVQGGKLIPWGSVDEATIKAQLCELVSIYEGSSNAIGTPRRGTKESPLSSSWFKKADPEALAKLKASTENFFKKVSQTPSKDNAWTTFKPHKGKLAGEGYSRGFLPNNLRATNEHIEKRAMAYLQATHYHPYIEGYFLDRGVTVYRDLYSLSEMLQWIWRSQVRRGDPIHLFIPSERMRTLLKAWLDSETVADLFKRLGYEFPTAEQELMAA